MARTVPQIRVGTCGWSYPHWRGVLYPPGLPQNRWLDAYAAQFASVEINASFYRLPKGSTFATWAATVPEGFVFAVKASRYITHVRRLRDCQEPLARLFDSASELGDKLGPVLFQLPPDFREDLGLLAAFLDELPRGRRFAFEFRHPSWLAGDVSALLASRGCAICAAASGGPAEPWPDDQPFRYVRLHAGRGGPDFEAKELDRLTDLLSRDIRAWRDVYAYFNNDVGGFAVKNARELIVRMTATGRQQMAA